MTRLLSYKGGKLGIFSKTTSRANLGTSTKTMTIKPAPQGYILPAKLLQGMYQTTNEI